MDTEFIKTRGVKERLNKIDIHAKITYHPFITDNYHWKPFNAPTREKNGWERGVTKWEQECLNTANSFLDELFNIDGFTDFFIKSHCRLKKEAVISFLREKGGSLVFPNTREYNEPFGWYWCQLDEPNSPGHIMDCNGWFYDRLAVPSITVSINGEKIEPFKNREYCFSSCVNEDLFAWKLCEASAYNVPYLYSIVRTLNFDITNLYEGVFYTQMDDKLYRVLELFDDTILPTYNVILQEDTIVTKAGSYAMHIVDTSKQNLREIIRKNKSAINKIINS